MFKRFVSLFLVLFVVTTLTACSDKSAKEEVYEDGQFSKLGEVSAIDGKGEKDLDRNTGLSSKVCKSLLFPLSQLSAI